MPQEKGPGRATQQTITHPSTRKTPDATATAHAGMSKTDLRRTGEIDWAEGGVAGARTYLVQKDFLSVDADDRPSLETLALVLMKVAVGMKASTASVMNENAVRAVAFLLEQRRDDALRGLEEALEGVSRDVQRVLASNNFHITTVSCYST
ncbi:hypothetical protein B0H10DRAFT_2215590 [Mycena sp. CBHHK59/15]|nr:hypothetical protein B0H10DRAFT_2215590 [Mycena sp. CBHHK59/15]